jgi:hypothetical protein
MTFQQAHEPDRWWFAPLLYAGGGFNDLGHCFGLKLPGRAPVD